MWTWYTGYHRFHFFNHGCVIILPSSKSVVCFYRRIKVFLLLNFLLLKILKLNMIKINKVCLSKLTNTYQGYGTTASLRNYGINLLFELLIMFLRDTWRCLSSSTLVQKFTFSTYVKSSQNISLTKLTRFAFKLTLCVAQD